ncbi:hypothetical protein [Flavobacterium cerinum]|uniref:DUF4293 family protein n=1 Tax=Flavobacterium cerinum TaxID=2502784 RepID=A0ABY5ITN0_9FLAO|nr:hypothetical protein [Flavobacterium cerinum]UUC44882.1 hypothetical protein NOX80_14780 [Flavobacterium cerinum]
MENSSLKNKFLFFGIAVLTFLLLDFGLGPQTLFGLTEPILYLTNRYFGIGTTTFDYAIIASFPLFAIGISINQGNIALKNIFSNYFKIIVSCFTTFLFGLLYLYFFQKPINPLFPEYLITEPFNSYSMLIISAGILFSILLIKPKKSTGNEMDQIGND